MCSSGGSVAITDEALQAALKTSSTAMLNNYNAAFGAQNAIAQQQAARLNYMIANPLGYTPQQLHSATTSINERTATAAKQAIGAAAGFAASHGGADTGSGPAGMVAGDIASNVATSRAQALNDLNLQNQQMKQQNLWTAMSGLSEAGSQFGSEASTAASAGEGAAGKAIDAGTGVTAAKEATWQNVTGVLSALSGAGQAAATAFGKKCWVAAAIYGGWNDPRTNLVRSYIFGEFSETWYGSALAWLYSKVGERVSKVPILVRALTPVFNAALRKAQKSA